MQGGNSFIQIIFYHFILGENILVSKFDPSFFSAKTLQVAFKIAKEYAIKYHEAPSAEQMKELARINDVVDVLDENTIDVLYSQKSLMSQYSRDWLLDECESWGVAENIKKTIVDVTAYIKMHQDDMASGGARDIVEHAKMMFNRGCVIDFDDDKRGSDFWNAESHKQTKLKRSTSGYDFIDFTLAGGFFSGALIVFAGAPKIGKSLWMQNLCYSAVKRSENCCYITLELPEQMVIERIGCNAFSIKSSEYAMKSNDPFEFKKIMDNYRRNCLLPPGQLWVKQFPTSTLTVPALEVYLLKTEEELSTTDKPFKFKNIYVDYLNIMCDSKSKGSDNLYIKVKNIAEDLRAIAMKNDWVMISATQTNKTQYESNDMNTTQISESSALGATVDAMYGIIADPIMMSTGNYYLKVLYDRVAPHAGKRKLFNCSFEYLRITESDEPAVDTNIIQISPDSSKFINNNKENKNITFEQGTVEKPEEDLESVDLTIQSKVSQNNNRMKYQSSLIKIKGNGVF